MVPSNRNAPDESWKYVPPEGSEIQHGFDSEPESNMFGVHSQADYEPPDDGEEWDYEYDDDIRSLVTSSPARYFLDIGGHFPYLLFSTLPRGLDRVIDALRRCGIATGIAGPSRRKASNQKKYAYYVRLTTSPDPDALQRALSDGALADLRISPEPPPKPEPTLAELQAQLNALRQQKDGLKRDLDDSIRGQRLVQGKIDDLTVNYQVAIQRYAERETEVRQLEERIGEIFAQHARAIQCLREQFANTSDNPSAAEAASLDSVRQETETWKDLAGEAESQAKRLLEETKGLKTEVHKYRTLWEQCRPAPASATSGLPATPVDSNFLLAALRILCPRIHLVRQSASFLEQEILEPRALFDVLFRLSSGQTVPGRAVQSCPSWREVSFSTGKSDDGRLYYKLNETIRVVASRKGRQAQDIEWMKAHDD